jgi:hypothetical protein
MIHVRDPPFSGKQRRITAFGNASNKDPVVEGHSAGFELSSKLSTLGLYTWTIIVIFSTQCP